MKKLLYFSLFSLFIVAACNNDDLPVDATCDIELFKAAVNDKIATDIFITSVEQTNNSYIAHFEDGSTVTICDKLVKEVDTDNVLIYWKVRFIFSDDSLFEPKRVGSVSITANPNPFAHNPLCATVRVSSAEPTKVRMRLEGKHGRDSDLHRFSAVFQTSHELSVFGLYEDHSNLVEITLLSNDERVRKRDTIIISTPKIDFFDPKISIIKADRANMEPGEFHLVSSLSFWEPNIPYMFDTYGEVRWLLDYRNDPEFGNLFYDVGIERLQNGNFYFGNIPTSKIYEIDMFGEIVNQWEMSGYGFHHNVQEKPDGNFLVTVNKWGSTHLNGTETVEDYVIEIDRNTGQIVHEWDFKQLLDENRTAMGNWTTGAPIDWLHLNAVIYDPSDNTIIVSGRGQGVVKVDYNDNLIWIMAPHKDWGFNRKGQDLDSLLLLPVDANENSYGSQVALGNINTPGFEWNWYQHAPKLMPNGNILLFDNGDFRNFTDPFFRYSRAVEYKVDATKMIIQQIWDYGTNQGEETHSRIISDVDYLPQTGNILFCPGFNVFNGSEHKGGRIVEIDYQTKIVHFEAYIGSGSLTFHRVERMPMYPD